MGDAPVWMGDAPVWTGDAPVWTGDAPEWMGDAPNCLMDRSKITSRCKKMFVVDKKVSEKSFYTSCVVEIIALSLQRSS